MDAGASITVDLDLNALAQRTLAARPAAIHAALEHIAVTSDANTPLKTGALVASRAITPEGEIDDIGWLGYYIWYAIFVHEILSNEHPHGTAKWLELAMLAEAAMAKKLVAHRIAEAI